MEPATSACPPDVRQAAYTLDMFQTSQVFGWKKGSWRVSRAVCKWSGAEVLLQMFGKDYMEKHSDLQRAAQAVRTLSHPHLLTVYAVFQDGNQTVLVYELPIKGPLDHEVDQLNKKVSERQVVRKVLYPVISAAIRLREPGLELSYVCPQDVWCLEGGKFKLIVPMTCQHVPQGPAAAALAQEFTAPELQRKIMIDADTAIDPGRALTYSLTVLAHYCLLGATPKNGKPSNGTISGASSDFGSDVVGDLPIRRHQPSVMTLLGLQKSGPRREKHDHHDLPLWMSDEAANFMLVGLLKDSCDRPMFQALLDHPWIHSNLPADALEEAGEATRNLSREGWRRTAPVLPMKVSQPSSQQLDDMMATVQADSRYHQQQQEASAAKNWSGWADPHAPPEVPPLPHIRVRTPRGSESRPGSAGRPLSGRPLSAAGPAGGKNGAVAALKSMHTMRAIERVEKRTVLEEPEADGQGAVTVTEETQVMGEVLQPGGSLAGLKQAAHSVLRANITTARPRTDHSTGAHWSSAVHAKTFDDIPAKQLPLAPPLESVLAGDYIDYEMEDDGDSDDGAPTARKSLYGGGKSFKSMKSMKSFKSFKRPTITGEKPGERLTPPRTARPSMAGGLTPPRVSRTGDVERITPPHRSRTPPATSA